MSDYLARTLPVYKQDINIKFYSVLFEFQLKIRTRDRWMYGRDNPTIPGRRTTVYNIPKTKAGYRITDAIEISKVELSWLDPIVYIFRQLSHPHRCVCMSDTQLSFFNDSTLKKRYLNCAMDRQQLCIVKSSNQFINSLNFFRIYSLLIKKRLKNKRI